VCVCDLFNVYQYKAVVISGLGRLGKMVKTDGMMVKTDDQEFLKEHCCFYMCIMSNEKHVLFMTFLKTCYADK